MSCVREAVHHWDREDVRELREMLREARDLGLDLPIEDPEFLPSAPIPEWVDTAWPVWARDKAGRYLVGDTANEVVTEDELREDMLEVQE